MGRIFAAFDAETVAWVGPDGTSIAAVPRYACEELVRTWETESVTGSAEFSRKCVANGIPHPAGNCFQDLGWAARPKVTGAHIRFVTWREYMRQVVEPPKKQWRFSPEDILTTLPWGEKTLQTVAQQVRSAENRLLVAEKMASMASALHGSQFPAERLHRAWEQLLWSQHHDAWITATTRTGRQAWAFQVASETMETEEISAAIIGSSAEALSQGGEPAGLRSAGAAMAARIQYRGIGARRGSGSKLGLGHWHAAGRVLDSAGQEIPCQFLRPRKFTTRGAALHLAVLLPGRHPWLVSRPTRRARVSMRRR